MTYESRIAHFSQRSLLKALSERSDAGREEDALLDVLEKMARTDALLEIEIFIRVHSKCKLNNFSV